VTVRLLKVEDWVAEPHSEMVGSRGRHYVIDHVWKVAHFVPVYMIYGFEPDPIYEQWSTLRQWFEGNMTGRHFLNISNEAMFFAEYTDALLVYMTWF
jgi:hypothetical protein